MTTPANAFRIVLLGDSLAAGTGDETGRGLAGRLGPELAALGAPAVEVTNHGRNGATTADLRARLATREVRDAVTGADAIVLSIGGNDLRRLPELRERAFREPLAIADELLGCIEGVVREVRRRAPGTPILLLGGYNPAPRHGMAFVLSRLVGLWDARLARRFAGDRGVQVVRLSDLLAAPGRLSRLDGFHPGGEAYAAAAAQIAAALLRGLD